MWTTRRFLAAAALTVASGMTVMAGAAWAPPGPDEPAPQSSRMTLTAGGIEVAVFSRCLGLGSSNEVIEHKVATEAGEEVRLIPGRNKVGRIVCERGLTSNTTLAEWRELVVNGDIAAARRNATFTLHDSLGAAVVSWQTEAMWPSEITHHFSDTAGREIVTFVAESVSRDVL